MADTTWYLDEGEIDFSDVRVQVEVTGVEEGTNTNGVAIRFRRFDENNWWEFGMNDTDINYALKKFVAGDLFIVALPGVTRAVGDVLKVEAYQDRINCFVNHRLVASVSDTDLMTNEDVGLRFSAGCVETEIDNFEAIQLTQDIRLDIGEAMEYQVLVDWDNDGGLNLGDFETESNLADWTFLGSRPGIPEISKEQVRSGFHSMKVTWTNFNLFQFDVSGHGFGQGQWGGDEFINPPNCFKFNQAGQGFDQGVFAVTKDEANPTLVSPELNRTLTKLVIGREYNLHAWVYIPSGSTSVGLQVVGIDPVTWSTINDGWELLEFTFVATATEHVIKLLPNAANPDTGDYFFLDEIMNIGPHEDITCYVLNMRQPLSFRSGRDDARSLSSISPAEVEMECDNNSQIFSPDNTGSVLFGYLEPGRPVTIRSSFNNRTVSLFHGFVDNYILHPDQEDRSVTFSCIDALQYLANAKLSTALYPSIQTGQAVDLILDAVNWPKNRREIDAGATTVQWWHEEDTDGLTAVQSLVRAEGIPAIAYVDMFGNFVFHSRHHELLATRSQSNTTTFRSDPDFDEPIFSSPVTFDIGWKDIINKVDVEVEQRWLKPLDEVWSSDDLIVIPAGELKTISIKSSDAFYAAVEPTVGYEDVKDNDKDIGKDIVLKTGSGTFSDITLTRTSGQSTQLQLKAGASDVTIRKIRLRAMGLTTNDPKKVTQEDSESVTQYGPKDTDGQDFKWINLNDMEAVAQIILGHRAERLPVINITLNNGHPVRRSNLLETTLQDRIHIEEMLQTFANDDFIIQTLEHIISKNGSQHILKIGAEKAREQKVVIEEEVSLPEFTFDVAGQGFDQGYFIGGATGLSLSENLFILDKSNLDEDGLGY